MNGVKELAVWAVDMTTLPSLSPNLSLSLSRVLSISLFFSLSPSLPRSLPSHAENLWQDQFPGSSPRKQKDPTFGF